MFPGFQKRVLSESPLALIMIDDYPQAPSLRHLAESHLRQAARRFDGKKERERGLASARSPGPAYCRGTDWRRRGRRLDGPSVAATEAGVSAAVTAAVEGEGAASCWSTGRQRRTRALLSHVFTCTRRRRRRGHILFLVRKRTQASARSCRRGERGLVPELSVRRDADPVERGPRQAHQDRLRLRRRICAAATSD